MDQLQKWILWSGYGWNAGTQSGLSDNQSDTISLLSRGLWAGVTRWRKYQKVSCIFSSEQRRTADILGVFWILHDTGYAVSEIPYTERKWWNRKVCGSIADPACSWNHQYVQHFFTGFEQTILCDWNVWKAVKCLCGYSLQGNGEHRCIKESSRWGHTDLWEKRTGCNSFSLLCKATFFYQWNAAKSWGQVRCFLP